jgi:hypothetical protein
MNNASWRRLRGVGDVRRIRRHFIGWHDVIYYQPIYSLMMHCLTKSIGFLGIYIYIYVRSDGLDGSADHNISWDFKASRLNITYAKDPISLLLGWNNNKTYVMGFRASNL